MSIFKRKLEHACRVYSVTIEELSTAIKISPFSLHLHETGQRPLDKSEMKRLCQYFDLMDNYFINDNIRYVDEEVFPDNLRQAFQRNGKAVIICYEVESKESPDISPKELIEIFSCMVKEKL